jgi:hypothetical protein
MATLGLRNVQALATHAGGAGEDNEVDENAGIALPNLINAVSIPSPELGSEFLE